MSHTYSQNVVHIIFSTKDRQKLLPGDFRPRMWAYAAGVCKKLDIPVLAIGGMEDHVHLLLRIPPDIGARQGGSRHQIELFPLGE